MCIRDREEGGDAEQRSGSPLAIAAMAHRNLDRIAAASKLQQAAVAGGDPPAHPAVGAVIAAAAASSPAVKRWLMAAVGIALKAWMAPA